MSAPLLLASLSQRRALLSSLKVCSLEQLRERAEAQRQAYGPLHCLDRIRRLEAKVTAVSRWSSEVDRTQHVFHDELDGEPDSGLSDEGVLTEPGLGLGDTHDEVMRQLQEVEDELEPSEPTSVDSASSVEPASVEPLSVDALSIEPLSIEPASVEPQSMEAISMKSVEVELDTPSTSPLDALTDVASDEDEDLSASAEEIAQALGGAVLAAAAGGALEEDLTGLEDNTGGLEELSLADLEASDLLSEQDGTLDLLGDDDSIDEGSLLSPVDPMDSLAEDEPVPGSVEEEYTGMDPALHPDALSLDGALLEPLTGDYPLALAADDEDEDSFEDAEAFGDYEEDEALGELVEDEGFESALFEVEGARGGGGDTSVVREVPEEHRADSMPAFVPTIRDRSDSPVGAAAAIRLNADGSAEALAGDDEENIEVEMPEADDEWSNDVPEGEGLNVSYVDEVEYVEEQESAAPELNNPTGVEDYGVAGQQLSGADFRPVEEVDSVAIAALRAQADQALEDGDLNAAAQAYTDILEFDPSSLDAYLGRGRCYLDLGDFAAAMSDFQKAEDLDTEGPEPLVAMGELFFARKEYTRAIEFFDQAVEMDVEHAMARCRRGISYYYKKSYRQAFLDLQKAYTLDPEIPNIRKYVQMAIKKLERSGESI